MPNDQLQLSLLQEVKNFLEINTDMSSFELFRLLKDVRSSNHPDRFTDNALKTKAEEKFKTANELMLRLEKYIQDEKLLSKPTDIIKYKNEYELVCISLENFSKETIIEDLKKKLRIVELENANLNNMLHQLEGKKSNDESKKLIELYKPQKSNYIKLGISVAFAMILGVLYKIDEIAKILDDYLFFDKIYLNFLVWLFLAFPIIKLLVLNYKNETMIRISDTMKNTNFISDFQNTGYSKYYGFTELNVFDFIKSKLIVGNKFTRFFKTKVLRIYTDNTIETLKNIFIYNLLSKDLIEISNADNLQRLFKVK